MENILEETKNIMRRYNIKPNKSLGQNFLINSEVVENIVQSSDITKDDMVSYAVYYGEFQYQAAMLST